MFISLAWYHLGETGRGSPEEASLEITLMKERGGGLRSRAGLHRSFLLISRGLSAAGGAPSGLAFLSQNRQAFVPDETTQPC